MTFKEWVKSKGGSDADYPMKRLIQYDSWPRDGGDDCMRADDDEDVVCWGERIEPQRAGAKVRVHIHADAAHADVVRVLRKILDTIENDPERYPAEPLPIPEPWSERREAFHEEVRQVLKEKVFPGMEIERSGETSFDIYDPNKTN